MNVDHRNALVVGGSSGVGRAIVLRLAAAGVSTTAVARTLERLEALREQEPRVDTLAVDAAGDGVAADLINDLRPDLIVLAGGVRPHMAPLSAQSWEQFSEPWQTDTKIAFEFARATLTTDMPAGTSVVAFASGAALNGSPQSGGYAGAKRMQHLVMEYARTEAHARDLDIAFHTVYPQQLIVGTDIAREAAAVYGPASGRSEAGFMSQWAAPLTAEKLADDLMGVLNGPDARPGATWGVTGVDVLAMA